MIHLNVKSNYSFGHGASSLDELLARAKELNIRKLALTDLNGLYGIVPFIKKASALGIEAIPGVTLDDPNDTSMRAVLLPVNLKGFGEVSRMITDRHLKDDFSLLDSLKNVSPDVFILSGNIDVLKAVDHHKFRKRLYGEAVYYSREDAPRCRTLSDYCESQNIPLVATNNVHFAAPEEYGKHRLLSAIFQNTSLKRVELSADKNAYLRDPAEIDKLYANMPEITRATAEIAEQCEVDLQLGKLKFPNYPIGRGVTSFEHLRSIAEKGLKKRYPGNDRDANSRLHYELSVIDRLGFTEYFLVVHEIKEKAVEWGMLFVGRGSAANSIVS